MKKSLSIIVILVLGMVASQADVLLDVHRFSNTDLSSPDNTGGVYGAKGWVSTDGGATMNATAVYDVNPYLMTGNTSGSTLGYTITGLDLDEVGGVNDSIDILFTATTDGQVFYVKNNGIEPDNAGWISSGNRTLDTNGEYVQLDFSSLSVNLNGGIGNGSGSFSGFSGAWLGSFTEGGAEVGVVNGHTTTRSFIDLTESGNDANLKYDYNTALGATGTWRMEGMDFQIQISLTDSHYVDVNNPTPVAPYATWNTAANSIQDAVDAAVSNDTVLVADGTYEITSEIKIKKSLTVQSVNGPAVTFVDAGGNCRVFSLDSRKGPVALEGLTITGGFSTGQGGGVYCQSTDPIIDHCIIRDNVGSKNGGGIMRGTAQNCLIMGNTASWGGGMTAGIAYNCVVNGNEATEWLGGGLGNCTAYNCTITGNKAGVIASGMANGTAYNCIIWNNRGEETQGVTMFNTCSAEASHGVDGNITNAPMLTSFSHIAAGSPCRGAGDAAYGAGSDIDGEAWLNPPSMGCDEFYLSGMLTGTITVSIKEGNNGVTSGRSMPLAGSIHGAAELHVWDFGDGTSETNNLAPVHSWSVAGIYEVVLTAFNDSNPGGVSASQSITVVDPGDVPDIHVLPTGNDANDGLSWATAKATIQAGADVQRFVGGTVWVGPGIYAVTNVIEVNRGLTVEAIDGSATTIVDGGGVTRCFSLFDGSRLVGFSVRNGVRGIRNGYKDAVVENCVVYNNSGTGIAGGFVYDCVVSNNVSNIGGGIDDATAYNCIVVNNSARIGGGIDLSFGNNIAGSMSGAAYNCIVRGNTAKEFGGGILGGEVHNCLVVDNCATNSGGGVGNTLAINCTIVGNSAIRSGGGGVNQSIVFNSIVYNNSADSSPNISNDSLVHYSCSPDLVPGVNGNIDADPLFIAPATGDYRLPATSPCINWGNNNHVLSGVDLGGNPRIVEDHVDMGCYEYQGLLGLTDSDGDGLPDDWEHLYLGGNADPIRDDDGDRHNNYCEWVSGMNPVSATSVFAVTNSESISAFVLEWPSVTGRWYNVLWTPSLTNVYQSLEDFIEHPQNSYTDTIHTAEFSGFYKVEVRMK